DEAVDDRRAGLKERGDRTEVQNRAGAVFDQGLVGGPPQTEVVVRRTVRGQPRQCGRGATGWPGEHLGACLAQTRAEESAVEGISETGGERGAIAGASEPPRSIP